MLRGFIKRETNIFCGWLVALSVLVFYVVLAPLTSYAAGSQEQCFQYLKETVKEMPTLSAPYLQISSMTYSDVEGQFSRLYKNASSFGIDLESAAFSLRVYSFGEQTGYVHPPYSPFPIYNLSEKWELPAKQYIIAEEYVDGSDGQPIFLSCALMEIQSNDLMGVTAERYLYDGPLTSLLLDGPSSSYKAWYTSNSSFDHENKEFVRWNRLFIYPKATQNEYFDRYTVAAAFPSNKVESLNIVLDTAVKYDEQGRPIPNVTVNDFDYYESGDQVTITLNYDALAPVRPEGKDKVFFLNSYYQEIQNSFPEFSQKIALRGLLKFDTVKELLMTSTISEFSELWDSILDSREFTKYALAKLQGLIIPDNHDGTVQAHEMNMKYETQLKQIADMTIELEARALLEDVTSRDVAEQETAPVVEAMPTDIPTPLAKRFEMNFIEIVSIVVGLVIIVSAAVWFWWSRRERVFSEDIIASDDEKSLLR